MEVTQSLSNERTATTRIPTVDVARAVAMIGVVVLNYHSYLNGALAWVPSNPSPWERLFNPGSGVLTTRFAAVFVLVAGVGVSLMTRRSRISNDPTQLRQDRLRLLRRGSLLYAVGYVVQWIWPGTILFYYGALFMFAALLFSRPTNQLLIVGFATAIAAAMVAWWRIEQSIDGNLTTWLDPAKVDSPRDLIIRTFIAYTHPLFPWLLFFMVGIVLGRHIHRLAEFRQRLMLCSGVILAATYAINAYFVADPTRTSHDRLIATILSTRPLDRGLLYSIGTLASSLLAICLLSMIVESLGDSRLVDVFVRAGQMSLSIYMAHIFFFNLIVHKLNWVGATGLDTALGLSLVFYALAIPLSAYWRTYLGRGPAEILYRSFGG